MTEHGTAGAYSFHSSCTILQSSAAYKDSSLTVFLAALVFVHLFSLCPAGLSWFPCQKLIILIFDHKYKVFFLNSEFCSIDLFFFFFFYHSIEYCSFTAELWIPTSESSIQDCFEVFWIFFIFLWILGSACQYSQHQQWKDSWNFYRDCVESVL